MELVRNKEIDRIKKEIKEAEENIEFHKKRRHSKYGQMLYDLAVQRRYQLVEKLVNAVVEYEE